MDRDTLMTKIELRQLSFKKACERKYRKSKEIKTPYGILRIIENPFMEKNTFGIIPG